MPPKFNTVYEHNPSGRLCIVLSLNENTKRVWVNLGGPENVSFEFKQFSSLFTEVRNNHV